MNTLRILLDVLEAVVLTETRPNYYLQSGRIELGRLTRRPLSKVIGRRSSYSASKQYIPLIFYDNYSDNLMQMGKGIFLFGQAL